MSGSSSTLAKTQAEAFERLAEYIIAMVAIEFDADSYDVMSKSRLPSLVEARWALIKILNLNGYSCSEIGRWLIPVRHHYSVHCSLKAYENKASEDKEYEQRVMDLNEKIQEGF